jgi:uncharacterized protein (DUF433 family)
MFSTPVSDLVEMVFEGMSDAEITEWAEGIEKNMREDDYV